MVSPSRPDVDELKDSKPAPPPKPRLKADCVILGYRVATGGHLQSLVLGTAFHGKLAYACTLTPHLSDEESAGLVQMLTDSQSPRPYLSVPIEAQWVVPKYSCRVTYESQGDVRPARRSAVGRAFGRTSLAVSAGKPTTLRVILTGMAGLMLESDELFVPIDAETAGSLDELGIPAPRYFPSPLVSTTDGLVCVGGRLAPDWLLDAYRHGIFPWPIWEDEPLAWWSLDPRAIFEFECVRISRRLARTLRSGKFSVTCNRDFDGVIRGCAITGDRQEATWLTPTMINAYSELHRLGHAHSIEVWHEGELAGGTYGVAVGGLFAAESMFYRVRDASKVAVLYLLVTFESARLSTLRHPAVDASYRPARRNHDSSQRLSAPFGERGRHAGDVRQRAWSATR